MTIATSNAQKIILDLCGGTGSWSRPYKAAGYDVRVITLPTYDVKTYNPPRNVYGILAAPPCTEFSFLNCKNEPRKRDEAAGMEIVNACIRIINKCNPIFWALENPVGHLRKYLGTPQLTFQPWWYGDPWLKRTDIWGNFNPPKKIYQDWDDVPKIDLYIRPHKTKPSLAYLHKSAWDKIPQLHFHKPKTDAEFRAMTPPGFARAFFEANR